MTIIRHFTALAWFESIKKDGMIKLEGCGAEAKQSTDDECRNRWKLLKGQYKVSGRYVWFTEQAHVKCVGSAFTHAIEFDAETIGARPWLLVRRIAVNKGGSRARKLIEQLETYAREQGDNPDLWWVCDKPVPLNAALEAR